MKGKQILAGAALTAVAALLLAGCEAENAEQAEITITPPTATVAKGGQVLFTARGWHDYTWSLSDTRIGVLSHTKGDSTVYTSVAAGAATQVLTVAGGVEVNDSSDTNAAQRVSEVVRATALIIHR